MASLEDALQDVAKQFLCCVPVKDIKWKNVLENISWEEQELFILKTIRDPLVLKHPLKGAYQRAFLKCFIDKAEATHIEVHDVVYDSYCALLAAPDTSDVCYKHYAVQGSGDNNKGVVITLRENSSIISQGTTGLCSWEASKALAEWCLAHRDKLTGKTVLELGSGIGLTGLCVARCCAPKAIYLTDCHPSVLKHLCENVCLNNDADNDQRRCDFAEIDRVVDDAPEDDVHTRSSRRHGCILERAVATPYAGDTAVRVVDLNWEEVESCGLRDDVDLVIAADVVYDPDIFECLSKALKYFLIGGKKDLCEVILACTERNSDTLKSFLALLETIDLTVKEIDLAPQHHFSWATNTPVKLFSVRSTAAAAKTTAIA